MQFARILSAYLVSLTVPVFPLLLTIENGYAYLLIAALTLPGFMVSIATTLLNGAASAKSCVVAGSLTGASATLFLTLLITRDVDKGAAIGWPEVLTAGSFGFLAGLVGGLCFWLVYDLFPRKPKPE